MAKESLRILAVNPGTRYLGVAVFYGADLRDWGVKTMAKNFHRSNVAPALTTISKLIRTHQINCLTLKTLHPSRSSAQLRSLVESVKQLARERKVSIREYSIDGMKRLLIHGRKKNKKELMESVAGQYPFLIPELKQENSHKNSYLVRMFEAVALGMVCSNELE